ncbi:MAG TPA: MFS transporter [Anaerolineaceae bacterium]|nr:MFS transporter [Anaerolineaceae bacterium]
MTISTTRWVRPRIGLIVLAYLAFISLGLPDGLLGVAWPSIRGQFSLPLDALGPILFASTAGYLTSSFFSGKVIARLGVGGALAASCAITGLGLIGYTLTPTWGFIILFSVFAGLGGGAIDAGLNTFIAANYSEGFMQWLHACFGVGVTLGPLIMTTGLQRFESWRLGYIIVGSAQLLLAVCFTLTRSRWAVKQPVNTSEPPTRITDHQTPIPSSLRQPRVWLSIALFFLYTGVEVTFGHWGYTLLTESRHIAPQVAGLWAGGYWGWFTAGRVLAGLYTKKINGATLLYLSLIGALAGTCLLWWNISETLSLMGIAVIGFSIAPIFPGLVSGTSVRVGEAHAANTIGFQISAAGLGGALISGAAGRIARLTSLEMIPAYQFGLILAMLVLYSISMWGKKHG